MKRFHVVRKQGRFVVEVAQNWTCIGEERSFRCFELAMRFYRYHVSFLGWKFGCVRFVPCGEAYSVLMTYIDEVG